MSKNLIITFDIDWAPDWCIFQIAEILIQKKLKATWFVTHKSPAIQRLREHPNLFELGIHPNFLEGSTQGINPHDVMKFLLNIVPEARSMRTHGLMQSSHLIKMMVEEFKLEYDVSLFLPNTPNIRPHLLHTSRNKYVVRIPYFWEDDIEMISLNPNFSSRNPKYYFPGLKIFNFHPIHVCLNSRSLDNYNVCKAMNQDIRELTKEMAEPSIYSGQGTMTFFGELVQYHETHNQTGAKISEIGDAFCSANRY